MPIFVRFIAKNFLPAKNGMRKGIGKDILSNTNITACNSLVFAQIHQENAKDYHIHVNDCKKIYLQAMQG